MHLLPLTILYYSHYFFHGVPFGKLLHHRHPQLFFCNMVIKGFKWHPIQKMASFCHPHLRNICPINWVSSRIAASMNGHFFRTQQAAVVYQRYTEVCFASFRSGGFTTMAVINQPEKKVAKRTSVHWFDLSIIPFLCQILHLIRIAFDNIF